MMIMSTGKCNLQSTSRQNYPLFCFLISRKERSGHLSTCIQLPVAASDRWLVKCYLLSIIAATSAVSDYSSLFFFSPASGWLCAVCVPYSSDGHPLRICRGCNPLRKMGPPVDRQALHTAHVLRVGRGGADGSHCHQCIDVSMKYFKSLWTKAPAKFPKMKLNVSWPIVQFLVIAEESRIVTYTDKI